MGERSLLVVDDDEVLLRTFLRAIGREIRVLTATTSEQARQLANAQPPDVVVVDYLLGGENGIDLVSELKARRPECRVVLMSGHPSVAATVAAMRAGADDVRMKPLHPRDVLRWVDTGSWAGDGSTTATSARVLWEHERRVVSECDGNRSEAARLLGVDRVTLRRHLRRRRPRR